jgi:hypothetical protein
LKKKKASRGHINVKLEQAKNQKSNAINGPNPCISQINKSKKKKKTVVCNT